MPVLVELLGRAKKILTAGFDDVARGDRVGSNRLCAAPTRPPQIYRRRFHARHGVR